MDSGGVPAVGFCLGEKSHHSCHAAPAVSDTHQLTWHERSTGESLPKDEIWLKVSGDKGGGSFKFGLQIVNRHAPKCRGAHSSGRLLGSKRQSLQPPHLSQLIRIRRGNCKACDGSEH